MLGRLMSTVWIFFGLGSQTLLSGDSGGTQHEVAVYAGYFRPNSDQRQSSPVKLSAVRECSMESLAGDLLLGLKFVKFSQHHS